MEIEVNDHSIKVEIIGNGKPVLLIPFVGRSYHDFSQITDFLVRQNFKVIAFNYRKFSVDLKKDISLEDVTGDIAGVIGSLNCSPVTIISHSLGSIFARATARQYPSLVESIICIGAYGLMPGYIDMYNVIDSIISSITNDNSINTTVKNAFFAETSDPGKWMEGFDIENLKAYYVSVLSKTPQHEFLDTKNVPMLIVQGLEDKIAPPETGAKMKNMFGDKIEFISVSNAGHEMLSEQPEYIADCITDYLRKNKNGKSIDRTINSLTTENKKESNLIMQLAVVDYLERKYNYKNFLTFFFFPLIYLNRKKIAKYKHLMDYFFDAKTCKNVGDILIPELKSGFNILDCNCGPGAASLDFTHSIFPGKLTGINENPDMVKIVKLESKARKIKNAAFKTGEIYSLNFSDNIFDVVWIDSLLLAKPSDAFKEAYRVLKPGGKIFITDVDWKSHRMYPEYRAIMQVYDEMERQIFRDGGNSNHARSFKGDLRSAGFKEVTATSFADVYGNTYRRKALAEAVLFQIEKKFANKKTDIGTTIMRNAWKSWAYDPESLFIRTNVQAFGVK